MDAALKKMFTFRQTRKLELAALKDSGFGHRDSREAAGALGNYFFSWGIEAGYKAATEPCHFREGMRLAALVDSLNRGSFPDRECVRFKVPIRIRGSSRRFRKLLGERCGCSQCDVLAETRPDRCRGVEGGRITFV